MKRLAILFALAPLAAWAQTKAPAAAPAPDTAACESISRAIDASYRRAVLANTQISVEGRDVGRYQAAITNELATINTNVSLLAAHRCPLPRDPIALPGIYSKAASACWQALFARRGQAPTGNAEAECIITNWNRDPSP